jgi:hypothetical protein
MKKLTIVLIVSDDTAEDVKEWADGRRVMFMGTETTLVNVKVEPVEFTTSELDEPDWSKVRFLPGSPEAAVYLGTNHWTDGQGNVHWLNRPDDCHQP